MNYLMSFEEINENAITGNIVKANKKKLGLPSTDKLDPGYLAKCASFLKTKGVGDAEINLLGNAIGMIPLFQDGVDIHQIITGIIAGDKHDVNQGIIGVAMPLSGKLISGAVDYLTTKFLSKDWTDYFSQGRKELVNMSDRERQIGFQKYGGWGWYEKWVRAGKPPLK